MKALIMVDMQNDFLPGGALAVKDGDQIIPLVNRLQQKFELAVATQDWHPKDHGSFASVHHRRVGEKIQLAGLDQILWLDHCIQDTYGADFSPKLQTDRIEKVFRKGIDKTIDSYSGFFDNGHKKATGLEDYLKERGVTEVWIVGLATDYCVMFTALDAVNLGFKTIVILPACRGVDLNKGDVQKAVEEMEKKGVYMIKEVQNV
jgi:nicotinamidase/pyrazinamidase